MAQECDAPCHRHAVAAPVVFKDFVAPHEMVTRAMSHNIQVDVLHSGSSASGTWPFDNVQWPDATEQFDLPRGVLNNAARTFDKPELQVGV